MSNQRQITHDNHTVPQFYLRRWSNDGKTLNCYNTVRNNEGQNKWFLARLKSASVWRDLYTQTINGEQDDSIERYLSNIEFKASKAIESLEENGKISEGEMTALVDLAIAQMARTPSWLIEQNVQLAIAFERGADKVHERLKYEIKARGQFNPRKTNDNPDEIIDDKPFPAPPIDIHFDKSSMELITSMSIGQRSSLYAMGRVMNGSVAQVLHSYPWFLIHLADKEIELPTSDNPFTKFKRLYDGSYTTNCTICEKGTLLLMPVTPKWLLITIVGFWKTAPLLFRNKTIWAPIVKAIVENANQYVYSRNIDKVIEIIRPSEVDPDYLQQLDKVKREWCDT